MRLTSLISMLLLLFSASGIVEGQKSKRNPPARKSIRAESKIRFASGRSALKIPFELFGNLILLQVKVNDSAPLRFILDTGADTSVLDAEPARVLRLKPDGKIVGSGGAGTAEATFSKGISVNLPGVQILDQTIYVLPLDSLSAIGRKIDGVIGNDIIQRFVVEIDYAAKSFNLYEPQSYRYSGAGEIITLVMEENLPFVRVRVTPEGGRAPLEAKLQVDSGSTGAVLFNTPFVKRHQLLATIPQAVQTNIGGVGGSAKTLLGRVKSMVLGRFVLDRLIARFSQATRGDYASSKYDGLLGGEILRRFKVIFDYARRQMIVEPNMYFAQPYEIDMSGMTLLADGDDVLIDDVDENSSAAGAGVQGGDILVAIDGRPAAEFTLDQIRAMFMQQGKEYLLSVKREGKVLQIRIKLKRLI